MRKINAIVIHCSATKEGQNITKHDIYDWHTWPCDIRDKNGKLISVKYQSKVYNDRSELPVYVRHKKGRGFNDIGYHYIIELSGLTVVGRPLWKPGAHVKGHNKDTIGICYIGGIDQNGKPKDTRTDNQKKSIILLLQNLKELFPDATIKGHRDYSPDLNNDGRIDQWEWMKSCPCFEVSDEF